MNKFKETINKIELNEGDKEKMLKNILNNEKREEKSFMVKPFVLRFAVFMFAFVLFMGTGYALVKYFNFDTKFKEFFGVSDEVLEEYGVSGNDVNYTNEFDGVTITINQSVIDEKEVYLMVDIKGEKKDDLIAEYYLLKGNSIDESIFEDGKDVFDAENCISDTSLPSSKIDSSIEDGKDVFDAENCISDLVFGCTSRALTQMENTDESNGYALIFSIDGKIEDEQEVTLRLIDVNSKTYDVTFTLNSNEYKTKVTEIDEVIYDYMDIVVTLREIHITPFRVVAHFDYNTDIELLDDIETENIMVTIFDDETNVIKFKDGSTQSLRLFGPTLVVADSAFGEDTLEIKDVDSVESVTINGMTFNIK